MERFELTPHEEKFPRAVGRIEAPVVLARALVHDPG
jgi:hypothetical protein